MPSTYKDKIKVVDVVLEHIKSSEVWDKRVISPLNGIYKEQDKDLEDDKLFDGIEVICIGNNAIIEEDKKITGVIQLQIYSEFIGRVQELSYAIGLIMDEAFIYDYNFYQRGKLTLQKNGKLIIGIHKITFKIDPENYHIETGKSLSQI